MGLKGFLKYFLFVATFCILYLLLKDGINSKDFQALIRQAHFTSLFGAVLLVVLSLLLKGIRLKYLAKPFNIPLGVFQATKIQVISISLATITPGRAGEFTKIFFLAKKDLKLWPIALMICIFERLLDFLVLVTYGLVFSLFYVSSPKVVYALLVLGLLLLLGVALLFQPVLILRYFQPYLPKVLLGFFTTMAEHKSELLKQVPLMTLFSCVIWILDAYFQWLIFKSIQVNLAMVPLVGLNAIIAITSILTILPVGLGSMDVSALFLYPQVFHISKEVVLFELMGSRVLGVSTLMLLFLPAFIAEKDFLKQIKKGAAPNSALTEREPEV